MQTSIATGNFSDIKDLNEFLTFSLGDEEYALPIIKVQEIRQFESVTPIANTPAYIKGVMNLRGVIVPIFDLRIRFNMTQVNYSSNTVVIFLGLGSNIIGTVVDGVSDVVNLSEEQVKPAPRFGGAFNTEYLTGLATLDERMIMLIDIEKLIRREEIAVIEGETVEP